MIVVEIAEFIQANDLGVYDPDGVSGDVFIELMPPAPDEAICVYSTGGQPSDVATSIDRPGAQIIVRGTADPRAAMVRAAAVHALFNRQHSITFTDDGTRVMLCHCRQSEPVHLGTDETGRHEYMIHLDLITGGG
jgi:hypothetical protein